MLYKVLNFDGTACHGGSGSWPLPTKNIDGTWPHGEWLDIRDRGEMTQCSDTALHLCQDKQVIEWLGPAIFEAEADGLTDVGDKCITQRARLLRRLDTWNERTQRLFACDCAEHVLNLFENGSPDDKQPRQAIEVARRYANGEATDAELAAALAAAGDAWAAAGDAHAAAHAAALAAAWAAWDARADAWAAAWDAAWDARAAAWAAAWADAWDARAAARADAWDAELDWQYGRLLHYLNGSED